MPYPRADAAIVARMLLALAQGCPVEEVAEIGSGVSVATMYRWQERALSGDARTLAELAAHGWTPNRAGLAVRASGPTAGAQRAQGRADGAADAHRDVKPPKASPGAPSGAGRDGSTPEAREELTAVTDRDGRVLLEVVDGAPAIALALGAQGAAGDDAAGMELLLEAVRMTAKGQPEAVRWDDGVFAAWLAASETLFPGVVAQLKRGEVTCGRAMANGVRLVDEDEDVPLDVQPTAA